MNYTELSDGNIDNYFKTLFNDRNLEKYTSKFLNIKFQKINYFLYGDYEYLNDTTQRCN